VALETYWAHRTKTGRVVYDRPKNNFTWRDVHRIVSQMETPHFESRNFLRDFWFMWRTQVVLAGIHAQVLASEAEWALEQVSQALAAKYIGGAVAVAEWFDNLWELVKWARRIDSFVRPDS
jgi:hypothetical protein